MPDSDPSHTASTDPRKEELATLFRQWDAGDDGAGQRARVEVQGIWLRVGVTVALALLAGVVMFMTAANVGYWAEPSVARDLGDVREDYLAARSQVGFAANTHVALRGLVPTRLVGVVEPATSPAAATDAATKKASLFFCPLQRIVVFTTQPLAIDPTLAAKADPRLAKLVAERLALPEETALSVAVTGRLLRGDQAPSELEPFVLSFAQRTQQAPADLWLVLDGAKPRDATWALIVWLLAGIAPLLSLAFLVRAVLQRRPVGVRS